MQSSCLRLSGCVCVLLRLVAREGEKQATTVVLFAGAAGVEVVAFNFPPNRLNRGWWSQASNLIAFCCSAPSHIIHLHRGFVGCAAARLLSARRRQQRCHHGSGTIVSLFMRT